MRQQQRMHWTYSTWSRIVAIEFFPFEVLWFTRIIALDILLLALETPEAASDWVGLWRILITPIFFLKVHRMLRYLLFCSLLIWKRRRWAYCQRSVLRSARVPNLAISLFRTLTSETPGSLITVVVGDVLTTVLHGTNVSQRSWRSFFDLFDTFGSSLMTNDFSVRGIGSFSLGCIINRDTDLFLSPLYLRHASTWAFCIASSIKMSLRSPVMHLFSSRNSSTGTVSASK